MFFDFNTILYFEPYKGIGTYSFEKYFFVLLYLIDKDVVSTKSIKNICKKLLHQVKYGEKGLNL